MIIRGRKKWLVFVKCPQFTWNLLVWVYQLSCMKMFSYFTHSLQVYYDISQDALKAKLLKISLDTAILRSGCPPPLEMKLAKFHTDYQISNATSPKDLAVGRELVVQALSTIRLTLRPWNKHLVKGPSSSNFNSWGLESPSSVLSSTPGMTSDSPQVRLASDYFALRLKLLTEISLLALAYSALEKKLTDVLKNWTGFRLPFRKPITARL